MRSKARPNVSAESLAGSTHPPRGLSPDRLVFLAGITAALHLGKLPPALPVLEQALGITLLQAGFLLSLVQLAGMLLGLVMGMTADNLGPRRSLLTGLLILALASLVGGFARTPGALLWLRAAEGLGFLLVVLPAPGLIRSLVAPKWLSRRLGLWSCYMGVGMGLALLVGPWVLALVGWQGWWWGLGTLTLGVWGWVALGVPAPSTSTGVPAHRPPIVWWPRLRQTLTSPGPWLVALMFAAYSSQWLSVIGFLPTIYAQAGFSAAWVGPLTAAVPLVNVIGNLMAGQLLHRGVPARRLLYFGFSAMAFTAFLAYTQLTADWPALRYVAVLLFSALGGVVPTALFSLAVKVAPNEHTLATTIGWMQQWSALGQFAGPPLVAWVATLTGGWQWTWTATGTFAVLGLLLASRVRAR